MTMSMSPDSLIKRSMHVPTRANLPSPLVPGYLYFVEDEGVILLKMDGEVHTYAQRGPQGPAGPAGPGAYVPPAPPIANPQPPSGGGGFPAGTVLQFNSLPWAPPEGTWAVDVTCTLSLASGHALLSSIFNNVRYQGSLTGGTNLTLAKLIEGAQPTYRASYGKNGTLPKEKLLSNLGSVSIRFESTTWKEKGYKENGNPIYAAVVVPTPGSATRKS